MIRVASPLACDVLLLPGWHGSGAGHWQTRWAESRGYRRLDQHDWDRPLRGDWIMQLEEALLARPENAAPVVLVAHSLGCLLVAAWAAHSRHTARVGAALLVAPPDVETPALAGQLHSWSPMPLERLPFKSRLLASTDDPYTRLHRSIAWAGAWGSQCICIGGAGHLNADSDLGDWPFGHSQLEALLLQPEQNPNSSTAFISVPDRPPTVGQDG